VHTGILWGEPREGDRWEEPGVDWRIILKYIFKKWDGNMDSIDLAQDWYRRRSLVNAETNI
jgi:hypothetical protein